MKLGLGGHCAVALFIGMALGWAGRTVIVRTPDLVLLSPRVQCGGAHEVGVPMAENIQWAVQSGSRWWTHDRGWAAAPEWRSRPGSVFVAAAPDGIRLAMKGFRTGNVAGTFIRAVKVEDPETNKPKGKEKRS